MKLLSCGGVLLTALVLVFPNTVAGQKKDKKPADAVTRGTPQEYARIRQLTQISGKLAFADAGSRVLALRLEYQHLEPRDAKGDGSAAKQNPEAQRQNLLRQQQKIMRNKNPIQRQKQLLKLVQQAQTAKGGNNSPFQVAKSFKEFEFEAQDRLVVRRMNLPVEYDDKGFLKTYSKEEIAKLRGTNASVPGYAAKYENLLPGQTVTFYLASADKADAGKQADAKKDEGVGNVERPKVRMVVILAEAPDGSLSLKPLPKKKKN
jgi:hypothetical protein